MFMYKDIRYFCAKMNEVTSMSNYLQNYSPVTENNFEKFIVSGAQRAGSE